jgi:hypothetical protein
MERAASYWRDLARLFMQFLGVALCGIPTALVYLTSLQVGASNLTARLVSLGIGGLLAFFVWAFVGKMLLPVRVRTSSATPVFQQTTGSWTLIEKRTTAQIATAAAVVMFCGSSQFLEFPASRNATEGRIRIVQETPNDGNL